jgi:hypothetical protein
MKKILLFSFLLLAFFAMGTVSAATTEEAMNIDSLERNKRVESFLEKMKQENVLSTSRQKECVQIFQVYLNNVLHSTSQLTLEEKKEMNSCINEMYAEKFALMEQKVEKLRKMVLQLKKSGEDVQELEEILRLSEEKLRLMKQTF